MSTLLGPIAGALEQRVCVRGLNFRVVVAGEGPTVLLLHGFPDTLAVWRKLAPHLVQAGCRVIAFDQRGCGESDMPAGTSSYTLRAIVDDIPAVLDALGVSEPVHVVGHDWGAAVAWGLALFHPQRVRTLVPVSVGHLQSYGRAGFDQKIGKGFYVLWFQLRGLAEWYLLKRNGLRRWLNAHEDIDIIVGNMSRPGRLTAALSWYRANLWDALFAPWPRCAVPTLGIWSDGDAYLTEGQMRDSERYVDGPWSYARINGCGHWIPLEAPEQLATLCINWFGTATVPYPLRGTSGLTASPSHRD